MYGVCICVPYVSRRCQRCRRGWRRETSPRQLAKTKGPGREKPGRRERDSARAAREAPLLSFLRRVRLFLLHSPPPFSYLALPLFPNPPYPPLPPLHRRCRRLHRRYHTTLRAEPVDVPLFLYRTLTCLVTLIIPEKSVLQHLLSPLPRRRSPLSPSAPIPASSRTSKRQETNCRDIAIYKDARHRRAELSKGRYIFCAQ